MSASIQKDGYKTGHIYQYPKGTNVVSSNLTARSDRLFTGSTMWDQKLVWFGIQRFVKEFLIEEYNRTFFNVPKEEAVLYYKELMDAYLGEGAVGTEHIEALHDLGYLPIEIKSLPEGSRVNMRVPVLTITNTLPAFYWLTNDLETVLSCELWKPTTCATIAYEYHRVLKKYAEITGSPMEFVQFQGHDFSMRGMSNRQDAANCGMAHMLSFTGTDTVPAIPAIKKYYNDCYKTNFIGTSVPASEHSTMCMGGKVTEIDTFRRLIKDVYPSGIVSVVSDTWDFWRVVTEYATTLKDEILSRPVNALGLSKVVIRPDSGDPEKILCGSIDIMDFGDQVSDLEDAKEWARETLIETDQTQHGVRGPSELVGYFRYDGVVYKIKVELDWGRFDKQYYFIDSNEVVSCEPIELTPEQKGAIQCLWEVFGGTITANGYKLLDSHIGLIYGDSITIKRAESILAKMEKMGFASANIVFGIGSYAYQFITRDTFGIAMKATYGEVDNEPRELEKDPVTDSGTKKSACGLLRVEKECDDFVLYDRQTKEQEAGGALISIFKDGKLLVDENFSTIRARLGAL